MAAIMGTEDVGNIVRHTQVYDVTHRGDGNRLPYMNRSFISFTFDGKPIEDFNLIATCDGDRMNRRGFAEFEDTVSTYSNLDGLLYWNTHYSAGSLDLTLSTDGIDLKLLDDFLYLFRAGETKELILAEHPNRAILARVLAPPQLNLLPFESLVLVNISGKEYSTSTTLYKGDILLTLVMDSPHWYSKVNILGKKTNDVYEDLWDDVSTGRTVSLFLSKDALKILYEDGIPLGSMIQTNMLLGNHAYANVESEPRSRIWDLAEEAIEWVNDVPSGTGARIEAADAQYPYLFGCIAGATISSTGSLTLNVNEGEMIEGVNVGYFFYAGTAPAPTEIEFSLTPDWDEDGYICIPANSYSNPDTPYNTLTIESVHKLELHFTTPNVYTSYNKAISIMRTNFTDSSSKTWEDIVNLLREEVRHLGAREWAVRCVNLAKNGITVSDLYLDGIIANMKLFLTSSTDEVPPAKFKFNSETGEATGIIKYRKSTASNVSNHTENVGDMLRSNYIVIRDRNIPDAETGTILAWANTTTGKKNSHRIYHNVPNGLKDISVLYKNMYL